MAVNLSIKGVSGTTTAPLRARAERSHRSLQGELMAIIEQAVAAPADTIAAAPDTAMASGSLSIERIGAALRARFNEPATASPKSADILRELRDAR